MSHNVGTACNVVFFHQRRSSTAAFAGSFVANELALLKTTAIYFLGHAYRSTEGDGCIKITCSPQLFLLTLNDCALLKDRSSI